MATGIFSAVLIFSVIVTIFLAVYTMTKCESKKKYSFVVLTLPVILLLLGHLFEIRSISLGQALHAKILIYFGVAFCPPLLFMFAADYCDIKLDKAAVSFMLLFSSAIVVLVWTNESHGLIYSSLWLGQGYFTAHLGREPGRLHFMVYAYVHICLALLMLVVIGKHIKLRKLANPSVMRIMIGSVVCIAANMVYYFDPGGFGIHYPVFAVFIFIVLSAVNIFKYDMFDMEPRASELAINCMKEIFILVDENENFISANESAYNRFDGLKNLSKYSPLRNAENLPVELVNVCGVKDNVAFTMGDLRHYEARISKVLAKHRNILGYIILVTDITESVILTKKLEEIAYTDALTGIFNRRSFLQQAELRFAEENAYILLLDLDFFKKVNDSYGHQTGDKVLRCAADRIKAVIHSNDVFGRYGGEEFILFASGLNDNTIAAYAERIRAAIANDAMVFDELEIKITVSVGASCAKNYSSLENAIKQADDALYKAKEAGRNRVVLFFQDGQYL